jgi:hypothetical protein
MINLNGGCNPTSGGLSLAKSQLDIDALLDRAKPLLVEDCSGTTDTGAVDVCKRWTSPNGQCNPIPFARSE